MSHHPLAFRFGDVAGAYERGRPDYPPEVVDRLASELGLSAGDPVLDLADGFHWFDPQPALAEIARVLRPGGGLAVLTMIPDWGEASWADDLGELIVNRRPQHPFFDGPGWEAAVQEAGGWSAPRRIEVTSSAPARPESIADYVASMSWVAALPDPERATLLSEVDELLQSGETPPELGIRVLIGLARPG